MTHVIAGLHQTRLAKMTIVGERVSIYALSYYADDSKRPLSCQANYLKFQKTVAFSGVKTDFALLSKIGFCRFTFEASPVLILALLSPF